MQLLLDTHIYLWVLNSPQRLSKRAKNLIKEADQVFISSASIWEAAIKIGIGKLKTDADLVLEGIRRSGFIELPISAAHASFVHRLPDIHRDPFDRLLIAQAMYEPLHLLTADSYLSQYSELVMNV